jgi:hypothetical protein
MPTSPFPFPRATLCYGESEEMALHPGTRCTELELNDPTAILSQDQEVRLEGTGLDWGEGSFQSSHSWVWEKRDMWPSKGLEGPDRGWAEAQQPICKLARHGHPLETVWAQDTQREAV